MSDGDILDLAGQLAELRPLLPYPRAQQEADWANPDEATIMRQTIWNFLFENHREIPLTLGWHLQSLLCLHLGNELSRNIFVHGCHEPNEFALLDRLLEPGMRFMDAGAHEGAFTVFAALRVGRAGRVWAFEPSRREMSRLKYNLGINDLQNVEALPVALGDTNGRAELNVACAARSGHNTFGRFVWDGVALLRRDTVDVRTLDSVIAERGMARLDVVKMDVEGSETRLLLGAYHVLRDLRPVFLFEASENSLQEQGSSVNELLEIFLGAAYCLYAFGHDSGLPVPYRGARSGDNLVAVPAEIRDGAWWRRALRRGPA